MKKQRPVSPCINICTIAFDDVCLGCGRSLIEIAEWQKMSSTEREAVWERIESEDTALRFSPI